MKPWLRFGLTLTVIYGLFVVLLFLRWSQVPPLESSHVILPSSPSIQVLFWTPWFGDRWYENHTVSCQSLSQTCLITYNQSVLDTAALIVFSALDLPQTNWPRRAPGQPWVLFSSESPLVLQQYHIPALLPRFNYSMSYRFDSTIPYPYLEPHWRVMMSVPLPTDAPVLVPDRHLFSYLTSPSYGTIWPFAGRNSVPVVWVASNCKTFNRRERSVQKLMQYIRGYSIKTKKKNR
jgi:hypothetical protein